MKPFVLAWFLVAECAYATEAKRTTGGIDWSPRVALYFSEFKLPPLRSIACKPDEVRIRLLHYDVRTVHTPHPSPAAIAVEIVGVLGQGATLLVDDDPKGYRWKRRTLSAAAFRDLTAAVLAPEFVSMKRAKPIATGGYEFVIEVATASAYQCVDAHWITEMTEERGLTVFRAVAARILHAAEVPEKNIQWGP